MIIFNHLLLKYDSLFEKLEGLLPRMLCTKIGWNSSLGKIKRVSENQQMLDKFWAEKPLAQV